MDVVVQGSLLGCVSTYRKTYGYTGVVSGPQTISNPHTCHDMWYACMVVTESAKCWVEPKGLKVHTGVTSQLAVKFINHSLTAINETVHKHIPNMSDVGQWTQDQIDSIVYPCAGDMNEDEITTLDDDNEEVDNDMVEEIDE